MPKKRFNIWMDTGLIAKIKQEAKRVHLNKVSTYVRVATLEKMERDQHVGEEVQQMLRDKTTGSV